MTMSMAMSLPSPDNRRRSSLPHLAAPAGPSSSLSSASPPSLSGNNNISNSNSGSSSSYLCDQDRASYFVASSARRPSAHSFFQQKSFPRSGTTSPPSASYSLSSSGVSSTASSPGEPGQHHYHLHHQHACTTVRHKNGSLVNVSPSPILTPFQWTSDLRQYIMTDIGPQPSNSQMPTLRSHSHLVRQRSYSKYSPACMTSGGTGTGTGTGTCAGTGVGGCENGSACSDPGHMTGIVTSIMASSNHGGGGGGGGAHMRYSTITDLCTIPQDEILPPMEVPLEKRFAHDEWDDDDEE